MNSLQHFTFFSCLLFKCLLVSRRASLSLWNERLGFLHILFFYNKKQVHLWQNYFIKLSAVFFRQHTFPFTFFLCKKSLGDGPRDKQSIQIQWKSWKQADAYKHRQAREPVHKFFYPRSLFKQGPWDLHANTCILPLASGIWVIWVWAEPATAGLGVESDQSETQWGEGLDQGSGDSGEGVR